MTEKQSKVLKVGLEAAAVFAVGAYSFFEYGLTLVGIATMIPFFAIIGFIIYHKNKV